MKAILKNSGAIYLALLLSSSLWLGVAQAQESGSQYWDAVEVVAHLDAEGKLNVRELQRMVFDGALNGGERSFFVDEYQGLHLNDLMRIDAQEQEHPLLAGNLEQVDHFDWGKGNVLRWRSRLPSDPPFAATTLTYRIDYVLTGILRYTNDGYLLNHDFAFSDRNGEIRHFLLRLTLDPVWKTNEVIAPQIEANKLLPGQSYVLRRTLQHNGAYLPQAVRHGALPQTRLWLLRSMVIVGILLFAFFLWREIRLGRFRILVPLREINHAWIVQHVLVYPPEVVGALWDGSLGSAEVAAVLARMTQEGKLNSRVETSKGWLFKKYCMHLELKVPRNTLVGHERALIDALFFEGKETNTDKLREHYKRSGFNPAHFIETAVFNQVNRIAGPALKGTRDIQFFFLIILLAMLLMPVHFIYGTDADIFAGVIVVFASFFLILFGFNSAGVYRNANNFPLIGLSFLILLAGLIASPVVWLLHEHPFLNSTYLLIELIVLWLLIITSILFAARTLTSPHEQEIQRLLRSARAWFKFQLSKPKPELENVWYPYLLAFGLGRDVDRWFRGFGGGPAVSSGATNLGGTNNSSFATDSHSWNGGGGNFGGGGASGTWASAAGEMASSLAAPGASSNGSSSSSSSGSSSSSSNSGGGGGGSW